MDRLATCTGMSHQNRPSSKFKRRLASVRGQAVGRKRKGPWDVLERLVGSANETGVDVDGRRCTALVDSGSMVSTISEHYYHQNLPHLPLHPLGQILQIEGAGDYELPYSGYIEVSV